MKKIMIIIGMIMVTSVMAHDYFVDGKNGNDTNNGSQAKPFKTLAKATKLLIAGDKLFIHGGVYRETVKLNQVATAAKPIIIQNYATEKVVISGADIFPVTSFKSIDMPGFDKNSAWAKARGMEIKVFAYKNFPINPAQVFINGKPLMQIGDDATSVALDGNWTRCSIGSSALEMRGNCFFYDKQTKTLYLRLSGNRLDPKAKIEVSVRQNILTTEHGKYIHIKGLTFQNTTTLGNSYGGVAVRIGSNCILENSVIKWCAGIGVDAKGKNPQVINCEIAFNGNAGFNSGVSDNFLVKACSIHHNNYRDYNPNWHTGGMKMIPNTSGTIENCKIYNNYGHGIWFDTNTSGRPIIIRGNTISRNVGGLYLELANNVLVENNFIIYNTNFAVIAIGSHITIKNNTISNNVGYCSVAFLPRVKPKFEPELRTCHDNIVENNLFLNNRTRIEIHLPADDRKNDVYNYRCDNNSFVRTGGSKFRYTFAPVGSKEYRDIFDNGSFALWQSKTGFDKNSYYWDGTDFSYPYSKPIE